VSIAVDPTGQFAYVANEGSNTVSEYTINPTTGALTPIGTVAAGIAPRSIAVSRPRFAGTPGQANCDGKSVSALAKQFGVLEAAAAAFGYPSVQALQNAIRAFCQ
jgi:YVTN family beta-propeller protein